MSGVIEIIAFCTSATSIFLASRQKVVTFMLGMANNTMFAILFYQQHLYSITALQCCYLILNIYGICKWMGLFKKDGEKKQLGVSRLRVEQMGWMTGAVLIGGVLLATLVVTMSGVMPGVFRQPQYPLLDACLTSSSVLAYFLMVGKKIEVWTLWIIIDVVKVVLYFVIGLELTAVLHIIYIGIAVDAIRHWRKELI